MSDKTYAEFHREMMERELAKQDAEWKRMKRGHENLDAFFLFAVTLLMICFGVLWTILAIGAIFE